MADLKRHGAKLKPSEIALLMAEAEGWKPEAGDEIDGTVLGVKIGTSTFGSYPIVFVLGADEEPVAVHCFHEVLGNEMRTQRPERGDSVYIKYLGPKEGWEGPKGYDPPQMYAVLVTKPGAVARSVWDSMPTESRGDNRKGKKSSGEFDDDPPF